MSQDLVLLLQPLFDGVHALGVGGTPAVVHAFAESLAGEDKIRAALDGVSDIKIAGDFETPDGRHLSFQLGGQPVEVTVRSMAHTDRIVADCAAGRLAAETIAWSGTLQGHTAAADITSIRPLADPQQLLARWRQQLATYHPALRAAVIARHLPRAGFWPDHPHYRAAIAAADTPYTQSIVMNTIHDLTQVLYALNERYYAGGKRLLAEVRSLGTLPAGLPEKLAWLVLPGEAATPEMLERQRLTLAELVAETKLLVDAAPAPADTSQRQEPEAVVERQLAAYNSHDLEAFLATYAEDVELERGGEVFVGLEAMRARYGPIFAAGRCRAVIGARMRQGEWIVDHETAHGLGPDPIVVLVAYRVRGGVIDRVRFMA